MLKFDKFLKNKKLREKGFRSSDTLGDNVFLPTKLTDSVDYTVNNVAELTAVLDSFNGIYYKSIDGNEKTITIYMNSGDYIFGTDKYTLDQFSSDENVKLQIRSTSGVKSDVRWLYTNIRAPINGRWFLRYFTLVPQSNLNGNGFNVLLPSPYFSALDMAVDVVNCIKVSNNYSVFLINYGYARIRDIEIINGVADDTGVRLVQTSGDAEVALGSGITGNLKYSGITTFGYGEITIESGGYSLFASTFNAYIKSPFVLENTGQVTVDGFPGPKLTEIEKTRIPTTYIYDGYLIWNADKEYAEKYNVSKNSFEPLNFGWDDISTQLVLQPTKNTNSAIQFNYDENTVAIKDNAIYNQDYIIASLQFLHSKILLSDIHPHLHFIQNQNLKPNMLISYRWYNNGENVPSSWTELPQHTIAIPYTSGDFLNIIYGDFVAKGGTPETVSSQIDIRIQRDTTNLTGLFAGADPYVGDVNLKYFDIHIQKDSNGSDEELTKL